jgi:hypothetical protein
MSGPGRTLTKNGDGLLALARLRAGGLQIDAGVVKLSPDGSVNATSTLDTLDIASGGNAKLDITGNKVIVHAGDVGTFDGVQYDGLTGQIAASYNVSGWDGPTGITTSMSDALSGVTTVAIASGEQVLFIAPSDTGVFAGQTITGAAVILAYTYAGDMNFDGLVDAADYGAIDNFVQFPGSFGYVNGDLNFDGVIDAGDYGIIDNTIQLQGPPIAMNGAAPGLTGVTPVPEPSACVFAILAATLIARRRRRRHRHRHRHRQELRQ